MSPSMVRALFVLLVATAACRHTPDDMNLADVDDIQEWKASCEKGDAKACGNICLKAWTGVPRDSIVQACFAACDGGDAASCGEGWLKARAEPQRTRALAEHGCGYGAPRACAEMLALEGSGNGSRRMTDRELSAIWETSCARHETLGCYYRGMEEAFRFASSDGAQENYDAALAYFRRGCASRDEQFELRLSSCERYACETMGEPNGTPITNIGKACRDARLPVKWLTNTPRRPALTPLPKDANELTSFSERCTNGDRVACLGVALRQIHDAKGDTHALEQTVPLLQQTCSDTTTGVQQKRACRTLHCLTGVDPSGESTGLTSAFRACDAAGINPDYNGARLMSSQ